MPQIIKESALVLHTMRWKESSKIVTLYTRGQGKLKVIARGALRRNNPLAARLETLSLIEAVISTKPSRSLQILTEADALKNFNALRDDIQKTAYALALLELINQTMQDNQADEIFFDFTITMLEAIEKSAEPINVLWYFLLKLTSFLGFKPNFAKCRSCGKEQFDRNAYFLFGSGSLVCKDCSAEYEHFKSLSDKQIQFLRRLQKYPHKLISGFKKPAGDFTDYTSFLLGYLNFHLEHNLTVNALSLITNQ